MKIETGQIWTSIGQKEFRIISKVPVEDHIWVHYIDTKTGQEYSCYEDSFLVRFTPIVNRH
jgi:hypothetical protein